MFREAHPDAPVLVPNDPGFRDYGRNPYAGYDSSSIPFLFRGDLPDGIPAMARVVVVRGDGAPLVVSMDRVRQGGYRHGDVAIDYIGGVASALDRSAIADSRDVGTVRVLRNGKDVAHDITFAFVAHAFHPEAEIITD